MHDAGGRLNKETKTSHGMIQLSQVMTFSFEASQR